MNIIKKCINSWTYFQKLNCNIVYPKDQKELNDVLHHAKNKNLSVIAMGHGCSYGDLFMHNKGIVINFKNLNKIISFNSKNKSLVVEPGVSISEVNQFFFKKNLTINSIPSNFEITIGGAIANNVYGKDSYYVGGYFCDNISKITYIDDNLNIKTLSKKDNEVKFNKFIGSIGLLGIIIEVEIVGSELKSQYLTSKTYYLNNFDEFFNFYKKIDLKKIPFCSIKLDPFSKNKKLGRVSVNTYNWDYEKKNTLSEIKDINLYKKISLFGLNFYLSRKKYNFIKSSVFSICALFSNRYIWKILNLVSFSYFKLNNGKTGKIHVLDLYNNNNFTDHNIIFKPLGFYSFQILIPLKVYYSTIIKLLKIIQESKNEPFMCQIMFLPKRKDFIYEIDDHVAFSIPFLKKKDSNNQELFVRKIVDIIIENKCQLFISKDNIINREDCLKIFPKINDFKMIKKDLDKNFFFSSSYYERVLK